MRGRLREKSIPATAQDWRRSNIGAGDNREPVAPIIWDKKTRMLVQSPDQTADYRILSKNEYTPSILTIRSSMMDVNQLSPTEAQAT
jgi:hypothetical protein